MLVILFLVLQAPDVALSMLVVATIAYPLLLNWATALEVAAANVVLYTEFLEHYVAPLFSKGLR